jgi:hypothetical protein
MHDTQPPICGAATTPARGGGIWQRREADLIAIIAERVWILSDGDEAGHLCAHSVWEQLGSRMLCRHLKLKEGKQPTDLSKDELETMSNPMYAME